MSPNLVFGEGTINLKKWPAYVTSIGAIYYITFSIIFQKTLLANQYRFFFSGVHNMAFLVKFSASSNCIFWSDRYSVRPIASDNAKDWETLVRSEPQTLRTRPSFLPVTLPLQYRRRKWMKIKCINRHRLLIFQGI